MSGNHTRRKRLVAAGLVWAAVAVLGVLAGTGFAKGSASAAQYQYGGGNKVTICHHTHSKKHPQVTITISRSALPAHQRHGDTMGACTQASQASANNATGKPSANPGRGHGNGQGQGQGNGKGKGKR